MGAADMRINADFTKRAVVHAASIPWIPSPVPGVERRMLDRIGEEVARATSIVRYAPRSAFSPHTHEGGEEFLVLDGIFQDEHGDFPAGTYVRNPPTSRHTPRSETGCTILVKLHQFDLADRTDVRLDTNAISPIASNARLGVLTVPLFTDSRENVRVEHWMAGSRIRFDVPGGIEALVLDGSFAEGQEEFVTHSWLRLPAGAVLDALAGKNGAKLWIKTGHLNDLSASVTEPPAAQHGAATEREALATLLPSLLPRLWRFALRLARDRHDAEYLVQRTCELALERRQELQPGRAALNWMFFILHSVWLNEVRARRIRSQMGLSSIDELKDWPADSSVEPETLLHRQMIDAVGALPDAQRVLLLLVAVEGLSYREAAEALDIPIGTVMSRLARARLTIGESVVTAGLDACPERPSKAAADR